MGRLGAPLHEAGITHHLMRKCDRAKRNAAATQLDIVVSTNTTSGPVQAARQKVSEAIFFCPITFDDRWSSIAAVQFEISYDAIEASARQRRIFCEGDRQCNAGPVTGEIFKRSQCYRFRLAIHLHCESLE